MGNGRPAEVYEGIILRSRDRVLFCHSGWNAVVQSQFTATSTSQVLATLSPQPPSRVPGTIGMGFLHVAQARLELLDSSDLP
ncbi:hypothetical protein AAY473_039386 [Plecturocebus cupreus]